MIFPLLIIDLFSRSARASDSLLESNSLKEAVMGALRGLMIEEMKLRNFSPCNTGVLRLSGKQTGQVSSQVTGSAQQGGIRAFLVHLTVQRKLSPNSLTGRGLSHPTNHGNRTVRGWRRRTSVGP